jgi:DNA-binding protein HU-beta
MNKKDLIDQVAEINDVPVVEADKSVNAVIHGILEALHKEDDVSIHGFGVFSVKNTPARKGRNPKTGESINIPAGKKVVFKPAKAFKDAIA